MVATHILLAERADALQRLTSTLAALDGVDADAVRETAERSGGGQQQTGQDYLAAQYLAQIAEVLAYQQARIAELEGQQSKGKSKR